MKPYTAFELALLNAEYCEYLANFDPTPDYAYDGYKEPMSFDSFVEEQEEFSERWSNH